MYGATIPEDEVAEVMVSKQSSKYQAPARGFGLVVALCVGVLIGALGTALLTPAPTPAPRPMQPILAADPEIEMSDDLMECKKQLKGVEKQAGSCYMQLMTCIEST